MKKLTAWGAAAIAATLLILAVFPLRGTREPGPPRLVHVAAGSGDLAAGAAELPLPAPPGTPIGGYPRLRWASEGVEDPPMVRALVLSGPGVAVAVASVDLLLVPAALRARIESRVADLGLDAVLVAATHTHSGPGGFWDDALGARFGTGPHDPAVEEAIAARVADAIRAAAATRGPARLSLASATHPELVRNRDGGKAGGRLLVARLTRPDGEAVGQLVVFPAHATIHASSNRLLSADWPGAMARALPGTTVFLQGPEGDQTWALPSPSSGPTHVAFGERVAGAVRALPQPPSVADPALAVAVAEVGLPSPSFGAVPPFLDRLVSNLLWSWMPARTRVVALRLGPVTLLAVPAEPGEAVGAAWRADLGPGVEVVSLVGDYVGYVETADGVRTRTGEARRTYLGPDLADVLARGLAMAKGALPPPAGGGAGTAP